MTIKEFSKLCKTTMQTLRYYDNINLLKPNKVDPITGYRHYTKQQSLTFLKIKSLQEATFSIEEIKNLLDKDDEVIAKAISLKIEQIKEKVAKLEKIKESYHFSKKEMLERIQNFKSDFIIEAMKIDPEDEYGINSDEYELLIKFIDEMMNESLKKCDEIDIGNELANKKEPLDEFNPFENKEFLLIYEQENFNKAKDVLNNLPKLKNNEKYLFYFLLNEEKAQSITFLNIFAQIVLKKNEGLQIYLDFKTRLSSNNKNCFCIFKKM